MVEMVSGGKVLDAEELTEGQVEVLSPVRLEILNHLSESASYPAETAEKFDVSKQRMYYHFKKLEEKDLIREAGNENISGGEARLYEPSSSAYALKLSDEGESFPLPRRNEAVVRFLDSLIVDRELNGCIVVGSPEQHGPDQVRSLDSYLAGEIAFKLGNYVRKDSPAVRLDTGVVGEGLEDSNMVILGGVLTNVIAKKFNKSFPAYFPSEEFPYRQLKTPKSSYTEGDIGVIAKTPNPEDRSSSIFLVAGIQGKGTKAAVQAFTDLEEVVSDYQAGRFYTVVRGLDLNSDGEIDDYKVIETSD